jgi:hypothetical protein
MRCPVVYTANEIVNWHISEEYAPGMWRPARCCGFWSFRHIRQQFRIAWLVLIGELDALNWQGTGEKRATETNYRDCRDPRWIHANKMVD